MLYLFKFILKIGNQNKIRRKFNSTLKKNIKLKRNISQINSE